MAATAEKNLPWSFTIEFDEDKAKAHGYNVDMLYEYVGKNIERFGNHRIDKRTWVSNPNVDEIRSQYLALSLLAEQKWVMQNIKSVTVFEDDSAGYDWLAVVKRVQPECIYA